MNIYKNSIKRVSKRQTVYSGRYGYDFGYRRNGYRRNVSTVNPAVRKNKPLYYYDVKVLSLGMRSPFFGENTLTVKSVILKGVGETLAVAPLVRLYLKSGLARIFVDVAVQDKLSVTGIPVLVGNDIAGEVVVPDPIVAFTPLIDSPTSELEKVSPELFPSCADSTRDIPVCMSML